MVNEMVDIWKLRHRLYGHYENKMFDLHNPLFSKIWLSLKNHTIVHDTLTDKHLIFYCLYRDSSFV